MRTHEEMEVQTALYQERNDCSVRAVATAFNMSYGRAHRLMKRHANRPKGRGPSSEGFRRAILKIAKLEGREVIQHNEMNGLTLNRFYKEHGRSGNWIVHIKAHAVGILDGRICDWTGDDTVKHSKTARLGYRAAMAAIEII